MKRLIGFLGIILLISLTVLAGDIPESLLYEDMAQVFFGEVLDYNPDKENPTVSVSPVKKIKGDVAVGSRQIYERANPLGNIEIKPGNIYLFTYFDENNPTDIFEVTSYDTKTLKLKNVTGSMWERFEKNLNEGKYEKAEQERIDKQNATLTKEGEEISLTALLEVQKDKCDKIEFRLNGERDGYEIDKKKFFKLADKIYLTDVKNTIAGTYGSFDITAYAGEKTYTVYMWDKCKVSGSRTAMQSAPCGDYIIKAADYEKLVALFPEEATLNLSDYDNFIYRFIAGALLIIVLAGAIAFIIGYKSKKKKSGR